MKKRKKNKKRETERQRAERETKRERAKEQELNEPLASYNPITPNNIHFIFKM
jgi:hypothetical protein